MAVLNVLGFYCKIYTLKLYFFLSSNKALRKKYQILICFFKAILYVWARDQIKNMHKFPQDD